MPQPAGASRPAASCAWTRTACLSGRLSVSRGQSALPYLLLLSMPRHTSSHSSSHALSSTLRRKTLSRLISASPISTQKGLSCPLYTRYPASQPIPITSGPIQILPTNPEAPQKNGYLLFGIGCEGRIPVSLTCDRPPLPHRSARERERDLRDRSHRLRGPIRPAPPLPCRPGR